MLSCRILEKLNSAEQLRAENFITVIHRRITNGNCARHVESIWFFAAPAKPSVNSSLLKANVTAVRTPSSARFSKDRLLDLLFVVMLLGAVTGLIYNLVYH